MLRNHTFPAFLQIAFQERSKYTHTHVENVQQLKKLRRCRTIKSGLSDVRNFCSFYEFLQDLLNMNVILKLWSSTLVCVPMYICFLSIHVLFQSVAVKDLSLYFSRSRKLFLFTTVREIQKHNVCNFLK